MNETMMAKELVVIAKSLVGGGWKHYSEDLADVIEGQVISNKTKSVDEIYRRIKGDALILEMIHEEGMSDRDLKECILDARETYGV